VLLAAGAVLPEAPAVLLSMAATAALTGAFHEDGLADTLDGIGGADRARALEIMRDSRIGTFGTVGLGLTLALKAAALVAMPAWIAAAALVAAHAASRLSALIVVATGQYLRPEGTGGFTADGLGTGDLLVGGGTGLLCLGLLGAAAGTGAAVAGLGGLAAGHLIARAVFERRLGGYTGDCLGATQQLSEAGLYLGVLAWH
jgi:adenosylcobinamide-GDP ribazoletransferase